MAADVPAVVGQEETPPDDGLLLPRPPGAIRRFWARHPRFADALVAFFAFVFSAPGLVAATPMDEQWRTAAVTTAIVIPAATAVALLWRRRFPVTVFVIGIAAYPFVPYEVLPTGAALAVALYSVAVYRSTRSGWTLLGGATGVLVVSGLVRASWGEAWNLVISGILSVVAVLLIAQLVGANVGGRKRYVEALIDRSRQLARERDRQSELAAAAERTRIAREMHDIVSHSLTVIVALSEGAAATTDPDRARRAAATAADTARSALTDMRAMLGVLRTEDAAAPLAPATAPTPHEVIATAQRAGYPITLRTTGADIALPAALQFAVGRVVQEGVTNAMRHAPRANSAQVEIRRDPDAVRIRITNDGVAVPRAEGGGFGLRGLRERVEHVGGRMDARRGDGVWTLEVTLPTEESSA